MNVVPVAPPVLAAGHTGPRHAAGPAAPEAERRYPHVGQRHLAADVADVGPARPASVAAELLVSFHPLMVIGRAAIPVNERPPPQVTIDAKPLLVLSR